jgi:hypothetical protein
MRSANGGDIRFQKLCALYTIYISVQQCSTPQMDSGSIYKDVAKPLLVVLTATTPLYAGFTEWCIRPFHWPTRLILLFALVLASIWDTVVGALTALLIVSMFVACDDRTATTPPYYSVRNTASCSVNSIAYRPLY